MRFIKGPEADVRYANFCVASDPPTTPPGGGVLATLSNGQHRACSALALLQTWICLGGVDGASQPRRQSTRDGKAKHPRATGTHPTHWAAHDMPPTRET